MAFVLGQHSLSSQWATRRNSKGGYIVSQCGGGKNPSPINLSDQRAMQSKRGKVNCRPNDNEVLTLT